MGRKPVALAGAFLAFALVFALTTGVAGAAKHRRGAAKSGNGGNSANAKKCQGTGYLNWVTTDGATFDSADACTAYAAQGGTLTPKPVTHQLLVDVENTLGSGVARVTSDPAGIDCVADSTPSAICTHDFTAGASVTLTARPSGGPAFGAWIGPPCEDFVSTCTVTIPMNQDVRVGAIFD